MPQTRYLFAESEIPYGKLQTLGISRQQMLTMPQEVTRTLLSGELTPLVQARVKSSSGKVYDIPMKLHMSRDKHGNAVLMTYPVRSNIIKDVNLSQNESKRLLKGETIRKEVKENGDSKMKFISMDPETRALIKRDAVTMRLGNRIAELESIKDLHLGQNQKEAIREGKPVELEVGGEKVTVGVDPTRPQGFKLINGDMKEWERQQKIRYDLENEGFMGYVMTDENRWEYCQVVKRLEGRDRKTGRDNKKESKFSFGMRI